MSLDLAYMCSFYIRTLEAGPLSNHHLRSGAGRLRRVSMDSSLETVLSDAGVDPATCSLLVTEGWTTASFREVVSSSHEFSDSLFDELCPGTILSLLQRSALKSAWRSLQPSSSTDRSQESSMVPAQPSAIENSWSEAFPPKLTSATVAALKQKFLTNYPSEVLTSDTQPSPRLLSLSHQLPQKKDYKWLPWKFRMSMSRAEEFTMGRAAKAPRLENVQLHQLLIDEVPALEISNQGLGLNAVNRMFELNNYAWAMVGAAHLHRLRSYSLRFMQFLSVRLDSESGLRAPTITEAQYADKHIWHLIAELCECTSGVHSKSWRHGLTTAATS